MAARIIANPTPKPLANTANPFASANPNPTIVGIPVPGAAGATGRPMVTAPVTPMTSLASISANASAAAAGASKIPTLKGISGVDIPDDGAPMREGARLRGRVMPSVQAPVGVIGSAPHGQMAVTARSREEANRVSQPQNIARQTTEYASTPQVSGFRWSDKASNKEVREGEGNENNPFPPCGASIRVLQNAYVMLPTGQRALVQMGDIFDDPGAISLIVEGGVPWEVMGKEKKLVGLEDLPPIPGAPVASTSENSENSENTNKE